MRAFEKLEQRQVTLPAPGTNLRFLSGQIARQEWKSWIGQGGQELATQVGKAAARSLAIARLAPLRALPGNLPGVEIGLVAEAG